jgi:hypothetical protein
VFGNGHKISNTFFGKIDKFVMVLDSTGNNVAFLRSNVIHDEVLKHSGIDVTNVVFHTETRHTKGVHTISSSENLFLSVTKRIKFH